MVMNNNFQLIIFIFSVMILYTYYIDFDLRRSITMPKCSPTKKKKGSKKGK